MSLGFNPPGFNPPGFNPPGFNPPGLNHTSIQDNKSSIEEGRGFIFEPSGSVSSNTKPPSSRPPTVETFGFGPPSSRPDDGLRGFGFGLPSSMPPSSMPPSSMPPSSMPPSSRPDEGLRGFGFGPPNSRPDEGFKGFGFGPPSSRGFGFGPPSSMPDERFRGFARDYINKIKSDALKRSASNPPDVPTIVEISKPTRTFTAQEALDFFLRYNKNPNSN